MTIDEAKQLARWIIIVDLEEDAWDERGLEAAATAVAQTLLNLSKRVEKETLEKMFSQLHLGSRKVLIGETQIAMTELKMSMQEIKEHNLYTEGWNNRGEEISNTLTALIEKE